MVDALRAVKIPPLLATVPPPLDMSTEKTLPLFEAVVAEVVYGGLLAREMLDPLFSLIGQGGTGRLNGKLRCLPHTGRYVGWLSGD